MADIDVCEESQSINFWIDGGDAISLERAKDYRRQLDLAIKELESRDHPPAPRGLVFQDDGDFPWLDRLGKRRREVLVVPLAECGRAKQYRSSRQAEAN